MSALLLESTSPDWLIALQGYQKQTHYMVYAVARVFSNR